MNKSRRIVAFILACTLFLTACTSSNPQVQDPVPTTENTTVEEPAEPETTTSTGDPIVEDKREEAKADVTEEETPTTAEVPEEGEAEVKIPEFYGLYDGELLQYVQDDIYADLADKFANDDYMVEDVQVIYISQDYLDELAYNSKSNIYFGYTLEDIEKQFDGTRYIFTLGDDGTTVVQPFEDYDDTFEKVIKNVAIGGGVILICVTVSVVSAGLGAPAVSMVFAAAAETGTSFALSSSVISGAVSAAVTGYQTKDPEAALKAAVLNGSESFKWGAITGCIAGGVSEAITIKNAEQARESVTAIREAEDVIPSPREAELLALEEYKGTEQVTYMAGKEVPWGTPGGTRPDVVRVVGDHIEAIEVKNYDLVNNSAELYRELTRQITDRVTNLPPGSTQRIVLNVQGRGYTKEFVSTIIENIQARLIDVYPNIPVDVMGVML